MKLRQTCPGIALYRTKKSIVFMIMIMNTLLSLRGPFIDSSADEYHETAEFNPRSSARKVEFGAFPRDVGGGQRFVPRSKYPRTCNLNNHGFRY